ncbi:GAF domain-containing protein [Nocardioides sp.]|uniref:GAF domain-containing protein n=1 Tax=Nocardioides sp. TaxID=35761 RepID=UPI00321A530C
MQPIEESARAEELYGPFLAGDVDLYERFRDLAERVREIAPHCVGMSISLREHGITITLMAANAGVAALDAVQYVDGGPCIDALRTGGTIEAATRADLDEQWPLFSAAARRYGVRSTLSLPVPQEDEPVAGFNLYGSVDGAFAGLEQELADVLGAFAQGAMVDADPALAGIALARRAPEILKESTDLAIVATLLARSRGLETRDAEERLRNAADRAAIPLATLLELMREILPEP